METAKAVTDQKPSTWVVLRQDDHGNQFVVQAGLTRGQAERLVAVFESHGHKQLYWAEEH